LREVATQSSRPAVRIQALSVLKGLGSLKQETLESVFAKETDPSVLAHILRLGDWPGSEVLARAASHADIRVRYQAVLSATPAHSERWLASVCSEATTNVWMRAAVLSALDGAAARQLLPVAWRSAESERNFALSDGLFATILADEPIENALATVLPMAGSGTNAWALRNTRTVAEQWRRKLAAGWPDARGKVQEKQRDFDALRRQMSQVCRQVLQNNSAPAALRQEALKLLTVVWIDKLDRELIAASLKDAVLRDAAIAALLAGDVTDAAEFLTPQWREFSPAQRERILNGLASRTEWTDALLAAVQNGVIKPAEVSIPVRNRLLASNDSARRERAEKLWPKRTSNRAGVVAEYRKSITAGGSIERGAAVFDNNCAACHVLAGRGTAVGPDIASFRDKSAEDFLVAILDPNAAIEPRYVNYIVETKSGGVFYGVIRSETATSMEMAAPGMREILLRADVVRIEALPVSLMPEGIEQSISAEQMNDLIAYLRNGAGK
jgi:putative heme-binding domain-containing protein